MLLQVALIRKVAQEIDLVYAFSLIAQNFFALCLTFRRTDQKFVNRDIHNDCEDS